MITLGDFVKAIEFGTHETIHGVVTECGDVLSVMTVSRSRHECVREHIQVIPDGKLKPEQRALVDAWHGSCHK